MPYDFIALDDALSELPTLRKVLKPEWIERERNKRAIDSDFQITRDLTTHELRPLLVSLDQNLSDLWEIPGASDWRKRLYSNPQEFRAIQAELAFARLLQGGGINFTHPVRSPGVDFSIFVGKAAPIHVEVTAPQKTLWADDLDGRLWYLSRMYDFNVRTEPISADEPIRELDINQEIMLRIVADSEAELTHAPSFSSVIERLWPCIGMRILWTPSADPRQSGRNDPIFHEVHPSKYITSAARNKATQMARGNARTLVICWNMLPFPSFHRYVLDIQRRVPFYGELDFSELPDQIHYLVLFQASYDRTKAPSVIVLARPGCEISLPDGFSELVKVLTLADKEYHRQEAEETLLLIQRLTDYERRSTENRTDLQA